LCSNAVIYAKTAKHLDDSIRAQTLRVCAQTQLLKGFEVVISTKNEAEVTAFGKSSFIFCGSSRFSNCQNGE
jgi:hypothetical protein